MRLKIVLAYKGTTFLGLQNQKESDNTILGVLYNILYKLNIETKIVASGRTDKGVHASRQIIHLDLPEYWSDVRKFHSVLNGHLPSTIYVRHIMEVSDDFHARYSAKRRSYRYILSSKRVNPFEAELVTFTHLSCSLTLLNEAMQRFEGTHNFEYFKKSGSETSHYVREIFKAYAYEYKGYVVLHFEANGFLRSQIRMMVAFLLQICEGKLTLEHLQEQLACRKIHSRKLAPSNGLYLSNIIY